MVKHDIFINWKLLSQTLYGINMHIADGRLKRFIATYLNWYTIGNGNLLHTIFRAYML